MEVTPSIVVGTGTVRPAPSRQARPPMCLACGATHVGVGIEGQAQEARWPHRTLSEGSATLPSTPTTKIKLNREPRRGIPSSLPQAAPDRRRPASAASPLHRAPAAGGEGPGAFTAARGVARPPRPHPPPGPPVPSALSFYTNLKL